MIVCSHTAAELAVPAKGVCAAIGVFDGVHRGHQEIIRQTVADARALGSSTLVVTFDRHPNAVVAPDRVPALIYSQGQKRRALESLGVERLLVIPFNVEFSRLTGETFIRDLARDIGGLRGVCVGADFVFGYKRSGNLALLERLGSELGFTARGMAHLSLEGEVVSSTRIREAIQSGNIQEAGQMLGRPYGIEGKVVRGDQIGRQLGFPTANLDVTGLILPPNGVYAVRARVEGSAYSAVLNIGCRPTLGLAEPPLRVEAHLLNFSGDLYEKEVELEMVRRLRGEMKFSGVAELRGQIAKDVQEAGRTLPIASRPEPI